MPLRSLSDVEFRSNCAALAAPPSPSEPAAPVPAMAAILTFAAGPFEPAAAPSVKIWFGAVALVKSRAAGVSAGLTASARAGTFAATTLALLEETMLDAAAEAPPLGAL
jgi:hypothetical protein